MGNYTLIQEIAEIPMPFPCIKSGSKLYHRSYGTLGVSASIQIDIQRATIGYTIWFENILDTRGNFILTLQQLEPPGGVMKCWVEL